MAPPVDEMVKPVAAMLTVRFSEELERVKAGTARAGAEDDGEGEGVGATGSDDGEGEGVGATGSDDGVGARVVI